MCSVMQILSFSFSAGLHRWAGVQGFVSRGGRFGGAAGQVEPSRGEKCCPARGGHTEGQKSAFSRAVRAYVWINHIVRVDKRLVKLKPLCAELLLYHLWRGRGPFHITSLSVAVCFLQLIYLAHCFLFLLVQFLPAIFKTAKKTHLSCTRSNSK